MLGSKPPAPGTQRRLLWPEAALLLGVSVRKLGEPYLWFQQAASLHEVTISFLDPQGHLLKPQPWESSCEIQRDCTRRLLEGLLGVFSLCSCVPTRKKTPLPVGCQAALTSQGQEKLCCIKGTPRSVLGSWVFQRAAGGVSEEQAAAALTCRLRRHLLAFPLQAGLPGSVHPLQPAARLLQVATAEVSSPEIQGSLDPLQQPTAQQQHVQHGPGGNLCRGAWPASAHLLAPGLSHPLPSSPAAPRSAVSARGSLCQRSHHSQLFLPLDLRAFFWAHRHLGAGVPKAVMCCGALHM